MWPSRLWAYISPLARSRRSKGFGDICSAEQFHHILERERARADRNSHQFSVVVLDVGSRGLNGTRAQHVASVLTNRIRFTDELGWFDNQRIAVLLPETPAEGARTLADDTCQALTACTSPPKYTIYTYPPDESDLGDGHCDPLVPVEVCSRSKPADSQGFCHSADENAESKVKELASPMELLFLRSLPLWKRAMDIVVTALTLILLSPIMIAVAVTIKLTSTGPVIFKQQRAGLGGQPFTFYKFRSMVVDAEARKKDLLKHNERTGPAFKMTDDPRVTRIGTFLRKWSLDELPQLFNVLKGDLSLVGPRPLPIQEMLQQNRWQNERLSITPGITCLWQVYARQDKSFDRWSRLDIEYITKRSPLLDLKILLMTLPAVLSRKGAC